MDPLLRLHDAGQSVWLDFIRRGLLISGDPGGDLFALDAATGKTLWHTYPGGSPTGAAMTYELAGRQYIITAVDSVLYAWSLPPH